MEELYIFGDYLEINTDLGIMHFIQVKNYPKLMNFVSILYLDKNDLLKYINPKYIDYFQELSLIQLIFTFKEIDGLNSIYEHFKDLFILVFQEDVFDKITTDEELNSYRNLIIEMNCINYEKPNPNPEIEYYNKLEKIMRERKGEVVTLKAMITSVGLYMNPFELTIYQLYAYFNRIGVDKSHTTTTLFRTVNDKIDIIPWYKDIDHKPDINLSDEDKGFIDSHLTMIPKSN